MLNFLTLVFQFGCLIGIDRDRIRVIPFGLNVGPPPAAPAAPQAAPTQETARRISALEANLALAKGQAVLVDVRPKEAYDASHAQGALSIPLSDIGSRAAELPKDKLVITYCT